MAIRTVTGALALGLLLAACEGDSIPPPSSVPNTEGTVQLDETAPPPQQPVDPLLEPEPLPDGQMEESLQEATEEAQERAQEIFDEVLGQGNASESASPDDMQVQVPQTSTPQSTTAPPAQQPTVEPQSMGPAVPGAVLPATARLETDTVAAAEYFPDGSGLDYVGVWAARAQDCELVDQPPFTDYAVITPETMRIDGQVCAIDARPLSGNSATIVATCGTGAVTENQELAVAMTDANTLAIGEQNQRAQEFLRCSLPS